MISLFIAVAIAAVLGPLVNEFFGFIGWFICFPVYFLLGWHHELLFGKVNKIWNNLRKPKLT
jgi:hypothetical protein